MCGGGSSKTSSTSTYNPTYQGYGDTISQAQQTAQTPFNYDTTKDVAGFSPQQIAAFNGVGQMQGMYAPYIDAASGYTAAGAAPISGSAIQGYMNPYTQQVVDAAMAQMNQQNRVQQSDLTGNVAAQDALGGNRRGVAAAQLAGEQGRNTNSTLASLLSGGYSQALGAAQGDASRQLQAGNQMANYGTAAQNAQLQGLQALLGVGNQQQQQLQGTYDAASGNAQSSTMWPYQNQQWLASLQAALGPLMGGTTSGTSKTSQSMGVGQLIGGGLALAGGLADGGSVGFGSFGGVEGLPWAQLSPAQAVQPQLLQASAPQQQSPTGGIAEGMKLGKSARKGVDNILRDLDPAKGWGASTVPTASLTNGAGGAGGTSTLGSLISGVGGILGFAEGGALPQTPQLQGSPYIAAPGATAGFAPTSYFAPGQARLAQSRMAPVQAAAPQVEVPAAGNGGGKGTHGGLGGSLSSLFGNITNPASGGQASPNWQSLFNGHADGGGVSDWFTDPSFDESVIPAALVTGSTQAAPPLSDFTQPEKAPEIPTKAPGFTAPMETPKIASPAPDVAMKAPVASGMDAYRNAISKLESGGRYGEVGPEDRRGDRPYGKYQIMGVNVGPWTEEILGKRMTPQQFLSDKAAQEKVFEGKFGEYLRKTGSPADAASMWHSGVPLAKAQGRQDSLGTRTPDYVAKFMNSLDSGPAVADNARGVVASRRDGPSSGSGLVAKGMDADRPAEKRYSGTEDKQAGGLLQRIFGVNFNPLRLDKDERLALVTAGMSMMSNGNIGSGGLAGLQSLQNSEDRRTGAAEKALKLRMDMAKERKYTEIGKDPRTGQAIMGWVDPFTQSISPMSGAPMPNAIQAATSASPSTQLMPSAVEPQPAMSQGIPSQSNVNAAQAPMQSSVGNGPMSSPIAPDMASHAAQEIPAGYREVMASPLTLPEPPKGTFYKPGPNGGYLVNQRTGIPLAVSQKAEDTKSALDIKKGEAQLENERQVGGVKQIVNDARQIRDSSGFAEALNKGRSNFQVGADFGGGYGVNVNPGELVQNYGRMMHPEDPSWATLDDIRSAQQRLGLIIARPLMKGQGAVTEGERKMISDAIGVLDKATDPADYQFKLNSVEKMIDAMNGPAGSVTAAASKGYKPNMTEVKSFWSEPNDERRSKRVDELAEKYNIVPADMIQYLIKVYPAQSRG